MSQDLTNAPTGAIAPENGAQELIKESVLSSPKTNSSSPIKIYEEEYVLSAPFAIKSGKNEGQLRIVCTTKKSGRAIWIRPEEAPSDSTKMPIVIYVKNDEGYFDLKGFAAVSSSDARKASDDANLSLALRAKDLLAEASGGTSYADAIARILTRI